ncbi:glycoside hydrolase family 16 protein [Kutzneria sp. CA-103260]|uniref:glycoside hydrolase family 16 protein n=1 Tax=Kutzneria sp. CA-103260 TaxID=2802641 RepID=UPI001BAB1D4A|nr:glycoside hydrolase family 16 protein [Kutzneria sp. CA-103260]QUQ68187.1 glucosidase [Kutzneria sp. CA-103260]
MRARRRLLAAASALAVLIPGVIAVTASAQSASAAPAPPTGFTTVWSDDFDGAAGSPVNGSNWLYDLGHGYSGGASNWGTGEVESMTNSTDNVYLDGSGHLAIKPVKDGSGNWTSGRIETQRTDFQPPAGGVMRIEASIKQPDVNTSNGLGYWPAFWALGAPARPAAATNWPSIGELDVMEDINGRSSEFATLHCGTGSGGPCNETTGLGSGEHPCGGCQTGFHTYAVELDYGANPQQLRYYLDGNNFFTVNASQVDATTWNNATQHGFFVILNVAIGGGFPGAFGGGPTDATVSGQPMLVDYVSVSTKG